MRTERGLDRLVNFSDAVVAIAITLLVLPLVELPGEVPDGGHVLDVLGENRWQFISFLLSFSVIGALWRAHHRLYEYLRGYDAVTIRLNSLWLLTIVLLPFTTQLVGSVSDSPAANAMYVGSMFLSAASLSAVEWWARRHPELRALPEPDAVPDGAGSDPIDGRIWVMPAIFAVATVLAAALPGVGLWALLLLLAAGPLRRLKRRRT